LKTLDACSLFVLSGVSLEDKQKSLSMGEFDRCHICMGIFNDLDSILGLISIIFRFVHVFLRLCLVLACSGFLL